MEEKEVNYKVELPKDENIVKEKKGFSFFSKAIFMENLKSNFKGNLIVGIGNALLIIIIVMIMSTLNISATSTAMKDLFDNADTETTLKSSAVGMYSSIINTADSYDKLNNGQTEIVSYMAKGIPMLDESSSTYTQIKAVESAYDLNYNISKDPNESKRLTIAAAEIIINNSSSFTNEEKELIKNVLPYYLDQYYDFKYNNNTSLIYSQRCINAVSNYALTTNKLDSNVLEKIKSEITNTYNSYSIIKNDDNIKEKDSEYKKLYYSSSFNLIDEFENNETVSIVISSLKESYNKNIDAYINDTNSYRQSEISKAVIDGVIDVFSSQAYYTYLPNFEVKYVTDELGYPIKYVETGEYDENGNPIVKEIRIKSYKPEEFIALSKDMGTKSNMIQKMRKEILTGTPYTQNEIENAKNEASAGIDVIRTNLETFMNKYVQRTNNKNEFFDGTSFINDSIVNYTTEVVYNLSSKQVIDEYNKKYNLNISSINQITPEHGGMTGDDLSDTIYSYITSGISSFNILQKQYLTKGLSSSDALLAALNKSSLGIMGQLPNSVFDSLQEMGELNTYGIIIGVIGFGLACILMPMVYTIILANNLVANKVETGSLAFSLATPIKRSSFIITEAIYLIMIEAFFGLMLFIGALIARGIGIAIGGDDLITYLPVNDLAQYALGSFMVSLCVSSICFLASCYFNKSNNSIGVGGGINIVFFILSILGLFGTKVIPGTVRIDMMNYFNYFTIISLYDGMSVMEGTSIYWYKLLALLGISIVCYVLGIIKFDRKDLPL